MKITVRTHHVDITDALKNYAQKKLQKLEKFFEKIIDIDTELDVSDSSDENKRQVVMVTIKVPGNTIRATETSKDMYASIDLVFEKLGTQLKKYKDKLKDRSKDSQKRSLFTQAPKNHLKKTPQAKETDLYIAKPMAIEDAEAIMEESSNHFLVFRNAKTEEINVLYRQKSKTFGLIEP